MEADVVVSESPLSDLRASRAADAAPVAEPTPVVADPAPDAEQKADEQQAAESAVERDEKGRFKGKDAEKRIAHLTWEREEARREAARYRELVEQRQQPAPKAEPAPRVAADASDPEPDPSDTTKYPEGQYDRAYIKDQARWEARQEFRQQQAAQQTRAREAARERQADAMRNDLHEYFRATDEAEPGWVERVTPLLNSLQPAFMLPPGERPTGATVIADSIVEAKGETRKALIDHFHGNPSEFQRISALHPISASRELGRLEARLTTAPSGPVATAPSISSAKPPIQPVGRDAHVPPVARSAKDINSLAEWRAKKARS